MHSHLTAADPPRTIPLGRDPVSPRPIRVILRHPIVIHTAALLGFIATGIAVTWPHATYLAGRLPFTRDAGSYTWGFWWMARSVLHLTDPWATSYIAAPVGASLGMHALMPLPGAVFTPVTIVFGPAVSYNLFSIMLPGLMAYAMYRLARLWVPSQVGAIAAGVFFGLSSMLDFQTWVHVNLAAGALFLPITLEAAVRLRRRPGPAQAIVLGLVLAACMLTDQESTVLALVLAGLAMLPWLFDLKPAGPPTEPLAGQLAEQRVRFWRGLRAGIARSKSVEPEVTEPEVTEPETTEPETTEPEIEAVPEPRPGFLRRRVAQPLARFAAGRLRWLRTVPRRLTWRRFVLIAVTGLVALAASLPQLVAIYHAIHEGTPPTSLNASSYLQGIKIPDMFLPSPKITWFGLTFTHSKNASTFGALATFLALAGLVLAWRQRRNTKLLLLLWFGAAVLALGGDLITGAGTFLPLRHYANDGIITSLILPYSWFIKIPGLAGFREPSRIAELGLIPVALLAAFTVNWIRYHVRWLLVAVLALAVLEAGLATPPHAQTTMPTSFPALDNPIAADHSASIVLDVPFGLRGGTGVTGLPFPPQTQVLATADGHPLANALLSRVPTGVRAAIDAEPFYADLIEAQNGRYQFTPADLLAARRNAAAMHIGWVLLWVFNRHLRNFLVQTGFRYLYRADGASVWQPVGYANAAIAVP